MTADRALARPAAKSISSRKADPRKAGPGNVSPRNVFQIVSYLQYPLMLVALAYAAKPAVTGLDGILDDANYALLYMGIGIGLSSLQDPTRTQNEISRKVWQNPRKGMLMLWILALYAFGMIAAGLLGSYLSSTSAIHQLSLGLFSVGLGMIGLLKTAIEMFEHHRLDKKPADALHPAQEKEA